MAEGDIVYVLAEVYGDLDGCVTGASRYVLYQGDGHTVINIGIENAAGIYEVHHPDAQWSSLEILNDWTGTLNTHPDGTMHTENTSGNGFYGFHFKGRLAPTDQPTFNNADPVGDTRVLIEAVEITTYNGIDTTATLNYQDEIVSDTISGTDYVFANELGNHAAWDNSEENLIQGITEHICPDNDIEPYDRLAIIIFDGMIINNNQADALLLLGAQEQGTGTGPTPSGEEDLGSLYFGGGYTGGNLGKGLGKGFVARW